MSSTFHAAASRGCARHDTLVSHRSFSFADYRNPARMGFGALRVLNEEWLAPGASVALHAHENMEILSLPLSGTLRHQGYGGCVELNQRAWLSLARIDAGASLAYASYSQGSGVYVFVIDGGVQTGLQQLMRFDGLAVDGNGVITFAAMERSTVLCVEVPLAGYGDQVQKLEAGNFNAAMQWEGAQ